MKKRAKFILSLLFFAGVLRVSAADTTRVVSPDGAIQFKLFPQNGQLHFSVTHRGSTVLTPSPLHFVVNEASLSHDVTPGKARSFTRNETYPVMGAHSVATDRCNGAVVPLTKAGKQVADLEIRVFNDGAAFRHNVSIGGTNSVAVEQTIFNLHAGSDVCRK